MPFHVPLHDVWRPSDLVEAFSSLAIQSEMSDARVSAVISIVEFRGIEILAATTLEERTMKKIGETTATLSFCNERLIDNILTEVDINLLMSREHCPDFLCLIKALEKCGYVTGSELEIVKLYLPNDSDAARLVDEIEMLNIRKENCVAAQDFVGAGEALKEQTVLRTKLEDKIRNRAGMF